MLRIYGEQEKSTMVVLTVSRHADCDAFLEPAVLTAISVDAHDIALLVLEARAILYLLLDAAAEKTLKVE